MKNAFIDCGSNIGQGLCDIAGKHNLSLNDENWNFFLFEPSADCYEILMKKFGSNKNFTIENKAVWNKEETKSFALHRAGVETEIDGVVYPKDAFLGGGGSLLEEANWKQSEAYFGPPEHHDQTIDVPCVDFVSFFEKIARNYDKIILKVDVEGAEYIILPELIKKNLLKRVEKLYVEFHSYYTEGKFAMEELMIRNYIQNHKINFTEWS